MPENRKNVKRWDLLLFLPVVNSVTGDVVGNIADLTTEGLLLFSKDPLPPHGEFALEIRHEDLENALLDHGLPPAQPIRFVAQARWSDQEGELYRSGMMFIELSPEAHRAIRMIVRNVARNFG